MTQLTNQQLDNQTIFDKALFGIRKQDYRKSANGDVCLYRSVREDGSTLACAVGHCIPDAVAEVWDADGFDSSIQAICDRYNESFSEFFSEDSLPLLCQLQGTHDTILSSESFEIEMMDIAKVFGLVYTPPQEQAHLLKEYWE